MPSIIVEYRGVKTLQQVTNAEKGLIRPLMGFWKVNGKLLSPCVTFKSKGKEFEFTDVMVSATSVEEILPPDCTIFKCLYLLGLLFFSWLVRLSC
jgi:hypothetical protein